MQIATLRMAASFQRCHCPVSFAETLAPLSRRSVEDCGGAGGGGREGGGGRGGGGGLVDRKQGSVILILYAMDDVVWRLGQFLAV